jgi:DNA processing protein
VSTRPSPAARLGPVDLAAGILACLPDMTTARLRALLGRWGGPVAALAAIRRGVTGAALLRPSRESDQATHLALTRRWRDATADDRVATMLSRRGTRVFVAGRGAYPIADDVPDRPEVLLAEGDAPDALRAPRVAVVGTRAATPHGLADAHEIGAVLGQAGVTVVSGLAIGIDGAAHEGALDAGGRAVGVVATGLDVVYPRRHAGLFERVRRHGLLVSELGYGVRPRRELFPIRNRIIAALADVVVVVEATRRGGARITAERAADYGRAVLAMPGSRRNPSAEGTNALLADGAHPLLEPTDVLVALGLTPGPRRAVERPAPSRDALAVLRACGGDATTPDQLTSRTGLGMDAVSVAVRELERGGWMERAQGLCWPLGEP